RRVLVATDGLRSCSSTTMPVKRCWRKGTSTRPPTTGGASAAKRKCKTMSSGTGRATSQYSGIRSQGIVVSENSSDAGRTGMADLLGSFPGWLDPQILHHHLQILPSLALLARIAQQIGGM